MRTYKGYLIEQITRVDYIVRDVDGNVVELPEGKWSFRTLKETKSFIDGIAQNRFNGGVKMEKLNFNVRAAQRIKDSMKKGTTRVVTMEEFAGSNKDFAEVCKTVGLEVVVNGYSVVVRK